MRISIFLILIAVFLLPSGMTQADVPKMIRAVPESDAQVKLSYAKVVKSAAPAVVNIYTKRTVKNRSLWSDDPFFSRFFGGARKDRVERSLGSGVIVRENGIIITNQHVIDGADEITVVLSDRREFEARVILDDERTDLAVLKLKTKIKNFPTLKFDDSDEIEVGDLVLAIGNPFGVGQTVTSGIISALSRTKVGSSDYQSFIQTDASVNPGNSGGALIDMNGRLIGINSAIFSRSGGSNGIGFAIPSNMVNFVLKQALSDGKLIRPWFGASGQSVSQEIAESLGLDRPAGVMVDSIYHSGPADKAGLEGGDIILSVDGKEIFDPQALRFLIALKKVGGKVKIDILRGEKHKTLYLPLVVAAEKPLRNISNIEGESVFRGLKLANLSPAFNDEIGMNMFEKGVIILNMNRSPLRRLGIRSGDIFETMNGEGIDRVKDLKKQITDIENEIEFTVRRKGRLISCAIKSSRNYYCR